MWKLKIQKLLTIKRVRLFQSLLFLVALWFIFWAHIYEMTVWNKTFFESAQSSLFNVLLYMASILAIVSLEIYLKGVMRHMSTQPAKTLEDLRLENELLKQELRKSQQMPSHKIGVGFLVGGALVLAASVVTSSTVLAFIGLGLAFWGGLFLFARPMKFVKSSLLDFTVVSSYSTIDRIMEDLNYKGKPIYMPPYPKEAYLPEYLKGLKEMIVFVPDEDAVRIPTIEELVKKQFLLKNPKGMCIVPPGCGLVNLFEREIKAEFSQISMDRLYNTLPTVIVNNLELAKEVEMNLEDNLTHVKIVDSVFKDLYMSELEVRSVHNLGCPLTSAIACALAKTSGKLVIIVKDEFSLDLRTLDVWYQTLEA